MNVMVLGGAGMLGSELVKSLKIAGHRVISLGRKNCDHNLDCLDFDALKVVIEVERPNVIVNCIAIVNLSTCEEDKSLAHDTHFHLSRFLADFKDVYNIYISTDSVYSGSAGLWKEIDEPNPVNYYAKSKLEGERPVLNSLGLVLRTNLYGFNNDLDGNSLFEWAYKSLACGEEIEGYDNVLFNPLSVTQLSNLICRVLDIDKPPQGIIVNTGSNQMLSKYEFVNYIAKLFNPYDIEIRKGTLKGGDLVRPMNTSLNITKMKEIFNCDYDIYQGIEELIRRVK
ncbi:dTDP-4-dehydrorhamnose reductase family protein [Shewanella salipaludis]|nr:SDR family oxidoreductase [Shewanella salipaludis]